MMTNFGCLAWVEKVTPNLLELYLLEKRVEKDFEEGQHVGVVFFDSLNPGQFNLIRSSFKFCAKFGNFRHILLRVDDSSTKENKEAKIFAGQCFADLIQNLVSNLF